MAARSKARKRALDILFESELRGLPTLELLSERQSLGDVPVQPYAAELVRGVASHSQRIDELISWNLVDWTLERMPAVDRNILRIGVYELLWADDVPDGVAISEAVALAAGPVNGQLAVVRERRPRAPQGGEAHPLPRPGGVRLPRRRGRRRTTTARTRTRTTTSSRPAPGAAPAPVAWRSPPGISEMPGGCVPGCVPRREAAPGLTTARSAA